MKTVYLILFCTFSALSGLNTGMCQPAYTGALPVNLRKICRLPGELLESSGIAIEGTNRIWSHEDSGNANKIYCFDTTGSLLRTVTVENADNIDWEDVTTDNEDRWYISDAGNNNNDRNDLTIYIIPSPETFTGNSVNATVIHFALSDQTAFPPPLSDRNYDMESVAWFNDSLYLFSKDRSLPFTGIIKMYVLPDVPGNYTARLANSWYAGNTVDNGRVTSADINKHTGELILLTNSRLIAFTGYPGQKFFDGTVTSYAFSSIPGQNEGIAYVSTRKLYMTEEGTNGTTGFLYEIILPQPHSAEIPVKPDEQLRLFPNPAQGRVKISCQLKGKLNLEIRDISWQVVKRSSFVNETETTLEGLKPGLYQVSVANKSTVISKRLLIQ